MITEPIKRGATSQLLFVFAQDLSSIIGAGKTGLTTASFTSVYYRRSLDTGASTVISLDGTMSKGVWKTGGIVEVDSANLPGVYQIGLPDAMVSASDAATEVELTFNCTVASGAYIRARVIPLVAFDLQTALQSVNVTQWLGQAVHAAVNGYPQVDFTYLLGTLLSESIVGNLAAAFKQWLNVTTPTGTVNDSTTLLARLGASSVVVVSPVTAAGNLDLVQGDSYLAVDGRSFRFTYTGQPSFIGGVALLRFAPLGSPATINIGTESAKVYYLTGTVLSAVEVEYEMISDQSARLPVVNSNGGQSARFEVQVTLADGSVITPTPLNLGKVSIAPQAAP